MVLIQQDSELMTNYVAANPVPAGVRFKVFQDASREPAAFTLGDDKKLHLIMEVNGTATMMDFGKLAGVGAGVQAFDVQQAPDLSLDISLASEGSGSTSDFWLFHNVRVAELLGPIPSGKVSKGNFPTIHHLFMSNLHTDTINDYPLIMVAFVPPSRMGSMEDLSFVNFTEPQKPRLQADWTLATNPKRILDVAFGTTALGDGVCVLYEADGDGASQLQFKIFRAAPDDDDPEATETFVVEPHCPTGTTCLSTFVQPDEDPESRYTTFILAGNDIQMFSAGKFLSKKGVSEPVASLENMVGSTAKDKSLEIKDIHVTQPVSVEQDEMHMWFTTTDDAVHYYTTKASDITKGSIVPLLPKGQGSQTSAMLAVKSQSGDSSTPGTVVPSLLSVDEKSHMTLLQQDPHTRVWQQYPWYHVPVDQVAECIPVQSYLLRMRAVAQVPDDAKLIPGCWLQVRSSGLVRALVNGVHAVISPQAQWFQADVKGVLNIMLQTDDATCHTFAVDAIRPAGSKPGGAGEQTLSDGRVLDPSRKVLARIEHISSAADVKACKDRNGEALFKNISDADATTAATSFQAMAKYMKEDLHASQISGVTAFDSVALFNEAGVPLAQPPPIVGNWLSDTFNEVWHFVDKSVHDVWEWGVHLVNEGAKSLWNFVVKIGNSVVKFTLDCVTAVVKAVTWVFKKLGAVIQDIIDFLGFFFNWGDVLETADSLATIFDVTLKYGGSLLETVDKDIDKGLETLRSNIQKNLDAMKSTQHQSSKEDLESLKSKNQSGSATSLSDHKDSVAFNWGSTQFNNGGGKTDALSDEKPAPKPTVDILASLWDDISGELASLQKFIFTPFMHGFLDILHGDFDLDKLLTIISHDVVDKFIDALKKLKSIVFKALELGISLVRDLASATINIPVLSWLWTHVIAGGRPLSILNLCTLLVAIPTTVLYKTVKRTKCPKLKSRVTLASFTAFVEGKKQSSDEALTDDLELFTLAAASGLTVLAADFEAISLVAEGVVEGLSVEKFAKWAMDAVGHSLDGVLMVFSVIEMFTDWPVAEIEKAPDTTESWCRWANYSLKLLKPAGLVVTKLLSQKSPPVSASALKKGRGALAAAASVPTLAIAVVEQIHKASTDKDKKAYSQVRTYLKETLEFGEQWGFAVAAWNDEAENNVLYVALAVKLGCAVAGADVKVLDFIDT